MNSKLLYAAEAALALLPGTAAAAAPSSSFAPPPRTAGIHAAAGTPPQRTEAAAPVPLSADGALRNTPEATPRPLPVDSEGFSVLQVHFGSLKQILGDTFFIPENARLKLRFSGRIRELTFDTGALAVASLTVESITSAERVYPPVTLRSAEGSRLSAGSTRLTADTDIAPGAAYLGKITIDDGKTLTLRENFDKTASEMAANTGTLRFAGGTFGIPLVYHYAAVNTPGVQPVRIAPDSAVACTVTGSCANTVTGEDTVSSLWMSDYRGNGYDLPDSVLTDLTWLPLCNTGAPSNTGADGTWIAGNMTLNNVALRFTRDDSNHRRHRAVLYNTADLAGLAGNGFLNISPNRGLPLVLRVPDGKTCRFDGILGYGYGEPKPVTTPMYLEVSVLGSGSQIFGGDIVSTGSLTVGDGTDRPTAEFANDITVSAAVTVSPGATLRGSATLAGDCLTFFEGSVLDFTQGPLTVLGTVVANGRPTLVLPENLTDIALFRGPGAENLSVEGWAPEGTEIYANGPTELRIRAVGAARLPDLDADGFLRVEGVSSWSEFTAALKADNRIMDDGLRLRIVLDAAHPAFAFDTPYKTEHLRIESTDGTPGTLTSAGEGRLTAAAATLAADVTVTPGAAFLGSLTIADGKTLNIAENAANVFEKITASAGTLRFTGGTLAAPLTYAYDAVNAAGVLPVRIAPDSAVSCAIPVDCANTVTGEDPYTSVWISDYSGTGYNLKGSTLTDLTFLPLCNTPGSEHDDGTWVDGSFTLNNVVLRLTRNSSNSRKHRTFLQNTADLAGLAGDGCLNVDAGRTDPLVLRLPAGKTCRFDSVLGYGFRNARPTSKTMTLDITVCGGGTQIFGADIVSDGKLTVGTGTDTPTAELAQGITVAGSVIVSSGATLRGSATLAGDLRLAPGAVLDLTAGPLTVGGSVWANVAPTLILPENLTDIPFLRGPGVMNLPFRNWAPEGTEIYAASPNELRIHAAGAPRLPDLDADGCLRLDGTDSWSEFTAALKADNRFLPDSLKLRLVFSAERPAFVFDSDTPYSAGSLLIESTDGTPGRLTSAGRARLTAASARIAADTDIAPGTAFLGKITIDEGKTLTLRENFADAASEMAACTGTLRFAGGTRDNPLIYTHAAVSAAGIQPVRIAPGSTVLCDISDAFANTVTGEDPITSLWITGYRGNGYDLSGSTLTDLTWLPLCNTGDPSNGSADGTWIAGNMTLNNVALRLTRDDANLRRHRAVLYNTAPLAGLCGNGFLNISPKRREPLVLRIPDGKTCRFGGVLGHALNNAVPTENTMALTVSVLGNGTQIFGGDIVSDGALLVGDGTDTPTVGLAQGITVAGSVIVSSGATLRGSATLAGDLRISEGAVLDLTEGPLTVGGTVAANGIPKLILPEHLTDIALLRGPGAENLVCDGWAPEGTEIYAAAPGELRIRSLNAPRLPDLDPDGCLRIEGLASWSGLLAKLEADGRALPADSLNLRLVFSAETPAFVFDSDTPYSAGSLLIESSDGTPGRLTSAGRARLTAASARIAADTDIAPGAAFLGRLTVEDGKTLTLRENFADAASEMAANTGTLRFAGGTRDAPIVCDKREEDPCRLNSQQIVIAADSFVSFDVSNTVLHLVRGENLRTSVLDLNGSSVYGFDGNSVFDGLTVRFRCAKSIGSGAWIQADVFGSAVLWAPDDPGSTVFIFASANSDVWFRGAVGNGRIRSAGQTCKGLNLRLPKGETFTYGGTFGNGGKNADGQNMLPVSCVVLGEGTQIFSGDNYATAEGAVRIGDGTDTPTVEINGRVHAAPVTVAAGATLRGTGTLGGNLTLGDGAVLDLTRGPLTVSGTFTPAADYRIVLPHGADEAVFLKGPAADAVKDPAALSFGPYTFFRNSGSALCVRTGEAPTPQLPKPNGTPDDTTDYTPAAVQTILTLTDGKIPTRIRAADGNGRPLTAAQISDALAVFTGIAGVTDQDGTLTLTVSYDFRVTAIRIADGSIRLTAAVTDANGTPADLAPGAALRLYENGTPLSDLLPTPFLGGKATFTLPLSPTGSPLYKVEAYKP